MSAEIEQDSPIEVYLDQLVAEMSTRRPRRLRLLLAEAEAHLRDDAAESVRAGRSQQEAEALAVSRFGAARDLVQGDDDHHTLGLVAVVRQVILSGLLLGGVGALAVGASGLIAAVIRLTAGSRALVDVTAGQTLSASDCARWLAADPGARSCRDAAIADWANETVFYRIAVGLVGGICVLAYLWLRRGRDAGGEPAVLPAAVTNTLAATSFGAAAVWTLGLGVEAVVSSSGRGSGQWLSASAVALAAVGVFGWRLLGNLRKQASRPSA